MSNFQDDELSHSFHTRRENLLKDLTRHKQSIESQYNKKLWQRKSTWPELKNLMNQFSVQISEYLKLIKTQNYEQDQFEHHFALILNTQYFFYRMFMHNGKDKVYCIYYRYSEEDKDKFNPDSKSVDDQLYNLITCYQRLCNLVKDAISITNVSSSFTEQIKTQMITKTSEALVKSQKISNLIMEQQMKQAKLAKNKKRNKKNKSKFHQSDNIARSEQNKEQQSEMKSDIGDWADDIDDKVSSLGKRAINYLYESCGGKKIHKSYEEANEEAQSDSTDHSGKQQ